MSTHASPSSPKTALLASNSSAARTVAVAHGVSALSLFLFFSVNHLLAIGGLAGEAVTFFACMTFTCIAYGAALRRAIRGMSPIEFGMPFDVAAGFFLANTLLFFLSLASPYGMRMNAITIFSLALPLAAYGLPRWGRPAVAVRPEQASAAIAGAIAIVISAIAATIWCRQGQTVVTADGLVVYQVWRDTFIHVREISAFAQAFGAGTLQDIKLAGGSAPIYHFASYIAPAAAMVFTKASAMSLYAGLQLPLGIFLTGVGAFCLAATFWGVWPAIAATLAVTVLPDAYLQGFANRYLSYAFISQVNLGMLYGLAAVALAWVFMVLGCRQQKLGMVILGYVFLLVCAFYKAHLFVANSFLLLMYPTVFFTSIERRWRIAIAVVFAAVFVAAVWATQSHPRIPVMRLDGSGISYYIKKLVADFDNGLLKDFFSPRFYKDGSKAIMGLYAAVLITLCTFGWWLVLTPLAMWKARLAASGATLWFPIAITANYLIMSLGLAVDQKQIGTPDELMNRPLVWAYFAVAAWTAAALYHAVWRNRPPSTRAQAFSSIGVCVLALAALTQFSKDLQTFPTRGFTNFGSFSGVPACMVQAAEFIRQHSLPTDTVQDAANDENFGFTALTERQLFAGAGTFGGVVPEHAERLDDLKRFLTLTRADEIEAFARERKLNWYLLHPDTQLAWPASYVQKPAFQCEGYRVYRF